MNFLLAAGLLMYLAQAVSAGIIAGRKYIQSILSIDFSSSPSGFLSCALMVRGSRLITEDTYSVTPCTGILLILTLAKAVSYRDDFNPTCVHARFGSLISLLI